METYEERWAELREKLRRALGIAKDRDARVFAADFAEHVQDLYLVLYPDDVLSTRLIGAARQVANCAHPVANLRPLVLQALQSADALQGELGVARAEYESDGSVQGLNRLATLGAAYLALLAALGACMATGLDAALTASERAAMARGHTICLVPLDGEERTYAVNDYLVAAEYGWQLSLVDRCRQ